MHTTEILRIERCGSSATSTQCGQVLADTYDVNPLRQRLIGCSCRATKLENSESKQMNVEQGDEMKGTVTHRSSRNKFGNCLLEVGVRILLFIIFIQLERTPAFKRKIHPEEMWLYKNPPTNDYVPASILMPASFVVPFTTICMSFLVTHDKNDFAQGNNAITLSLGLNGVLTSLLKITVGRPRPDFFYRCFPGGVVVNSDMECTGDQRIVNEGRKSFPSGHASFAFAGFGFIFLYLAAKLHVFNEKGRGESWRLCISVFPLIVALLVAISRTCDYHHHWQDVFIGSLVGFFITYVCYRQYYPSIFSVNPDRPLKVRPQSTGKCYVAVAENEDHSEQKSLIDEEKDSKWI